MIVGKISPITVKGNLMKTKLLIEQHFHGCYGVDFNKATTEDVLDLSYKMRKDGFGGIFPTLVTDSVENIKNQINVIKQAASRQTPDMAKICGIHLEGIFLNPLKKGIHNKSYFLPPTVENFKLIEDDFIKIITLAPELVQDNLLKYLHKKGIKVQAGHCLGDDLAGCDGVTHIFNAMGGFTHKQETSTVLSALTDNNLYTEIIADGVHVNDKALKVLFSMKPKDKIILVSDSLPCTHSDITNFMFADRPITFNGKEAVSSDGTLAGSTKLLPDIIKILGEKKMMKPEYIDNPYNYHKLNISGEIEWDEEYNIVNII